MHAGPHPPGPRAFVTPSICGGKVRSMLWSLEPLLLVTLLLRASKKRMKRTMICIQEHPREQIVTYKRGDFFYLQNKYVNRVSALTVRFHPFFCRESNASYFLGQKGNCPGRPIYCLFWFAGSLQYKLKVALSFWRRSRICAVTNSIICQVKKKKKKCCRRF